MRALRLAAAVLLGVEPPNMNRHRVKHVLSDVRRIRGLHAGLSSPTVNHRSV